MSGRHWIFAGFTDSDLFVKIKRITTSLIQMESS